MPESRDGLFGGRPETPNEHWLAGEQARREGMPRAHCPVAYPGSRWEWEAGWDHVDATETCPPILTLDDVIRRAYCGEIEEACDAQI